MTVFATITDLYAYDKYVGETWSQYVKRPTLIAQNEGL